MYRTDKHIERFLCDAQTLSDILIKSGIKHEFILVANDPTDKETLALKLLTSPFRTLYVVREPIYASWNRGILEARGDFITFWGVDDTRFGKAIVDGVTELTKTGNDIGYFPFQYHRFIRFFGLSILAKIKKFTPPKFDRARFMKEMHLGPHFIVRKSVFEKIGYFDAKFKIAGDFEFQARAATNGVTFQFIPTTSGIFRNDGSTLSGSRSTLHKQENELILNKFNVL